MPGGITSYRRPERTVKGPLGMASRKSPMKHERTICGKKNQSAGVKESRGCGSRGHGSTI